MAEERVVLTSEIIPDRRVDVGAINRVWVAAARTRLRVYTWTVRTRADRALALANADALIWESDGRP